MNLMNLAEIVKPKLSYSNMRLCILFIYYMSIVKNNIIRGALVLHAAICITLFRKNVVRGNLSKFNDIILSQYTVPVSKNNTSNCVVLLNGTLRCAVLKVADEIMLKIAHHFPCVFRTTHFAFKAIFYSLKNQLLTHAYPSFSADNH